MCFYLYHTETCMWATLKICSGLFGVRRIRDSCTVCVPSHSKHRGTVGGCRCAKVTVGHAHRGGLVYTAVYKRHHVWQECPVIGIHIPRKKRAFVRSFVRSFSTYSGLGENRRTSVSPGILFLRDEFSGGWGILFQVPFVLVAFQKIAFDTLHPASTL